MTRAEWVKVIDERQNMYVKQLADIIKQNSLRKEIFFNSPTGTGKTVMIAKLINLLNEEEYFFIITTLSRGGLNHQVETKNDKNLFLMRYLLFYSFDIMIPSANSLPIIIKSPKAPQTPLSRKFPCNIPPPQKSNHQSPAFPEAPPVPCHLS